MPKFVRLDEAALILDTTVNTLYVTACNYKKSRGEYPKWYASDGSRGAKKSYIDVEPLLTMRNREMVWQEKCSNEFYWYIIDKMGYNENKLAIVLARESTQFKNQISWRTFMRTNLFTTPCIRFFDKVTRISEFHRICDALIASHKQGINNEGYKQTRKKMATA